MLNKFEKEILNRVERKIDELGLDDRPFMSGRRKVTSIMGIIKEMQLNDDWLEGVEDIEGIKDMLKEMDEKGPSKDLEEAFKLMIYRKTGVGNPIKEEESFSATEALLEGFTFGLYKGNNSKPVKPVEPIEFVKTVESVEQETPTTFGELIATVIILVVFIGLAFTTMRMLINSGLLF
jgi:hypothetical protein